MAVVSGRRAPSCVTTCMRHVFIARVWPLLVQPQTKYAPVTTNSQTFIAYWNTGA